MLYLQMRPRLRLKHMSLDDKEQAELLYAYSASRDTYFLSLFNNEFTELKMIERFGADIENAIKYGKCFGCYDKDKLVGMLLGFSLFDWKNNRKQELSRIFNADNEFVQNVTRFLNGQNCDIFYIFAICVAEEYRCRGIATMLIRQVCSELGQTYVFVSDALNKDAMPMWLSNGFKEVHLDNTMIVLRD